MSLFYEHLISISVSLVFVFFSSFCWLVRIRIFFPSHFDYIGFCLLITCKKYVLFKSLTLFFLIKGKPINFDFYLFQFLFLIKKILIPWKALKSFACILRSPFTTPARGRERKYTFKLLCWTMIWILSVDY